MSPAIWVFRTNIQQQKDVEAIRKVLDTNPDVLKWNVDRDDIDCVLRIETFTLQPANIIQLVNGAGYVCEELED